MEEKSKDQESWLTSPRSHSREVDRLLSALSWGERVLVGVEVRCSLSWLEIWPGLLRSQKSHRV